ncbi:MAG: DUF86 domain-containing protein [Acidobacteria bacterium]|nr:DUF86 domain-containing protein [Acidobacteriota bacterium]
MTLNADLVRQRCGEIAESLARLEVLRQMPKADFLASQDAKDIACYRLLLAIEAALALCYHWSAKHLRTTPEDYAACFGALADAGLITRALADRLQRMARFRNLLIHMYWKVDYERVYQILRDDLDDLRAFSAAVAAQL